MMCVYRVLCDFFGVLFSFVFVFCIFFFSYTILLLCERNSIFRDVGDSFRPNEDSSL